jgi:Zn-dependent peptidase ImmA (M78 family)
MSPYESPLAIIEDFRISDPSEIDIEAIAQSRGATIVYEPMEGCAARILGNGEQAIITVDDGPNLGRRRFSAAHEFGHWMRDRAKIRFSCTDQAMLTSWVNIDTERGANEYAADLLMPKTLFVPAARNKPLTFDSAQELGGLFRTSLTATAIRLLRYGSFPGMLLFIENGVRKWFIRGGDVPDTLWPLEFPTKATYAADLVCDFASDGASGPVQADGWIDHPQSRWYEVHEHSCRISRSGILTLLWWRDEKQLLDLTRDEE